MSNLSNCFLTFIIYFPCKEENKFLSFLSAFPSPSFRILFPFPPPNLISSHRHLRILVCYGKRMIFSSLSSAHHFRTLVPALIFVDITCDVRDFLFILKRFSSLFLRSQQKSPVRLCCSSSSSNRASVDKLRWTCTSQWSHFSCFAINPNLVALREQSSSGYKLTKFCSFSW